MGVVHGQAPLSKKPVMLCRCRTTLNAGAMPGLFPLPQLQAPSRVAGSFAGPKVDSRGLGADMLSDALRRIAAVSRSIGIAAVLVQAKDENAKRFYMACAEFIEIS
jgi:hypothetical protein